LEANVGDVTVSAIVSAYFAEPYLYDRLTNLSEQSINPEIVVVCQKGSPEEGVVAEWVEVHSLKSTPTRLEVVTTDDVPTVYRAWNLGIKAANSLLVTSANSDDRWYKEGLTKVANELAEHPKFALAYSDVDKVEQIGGPVTGTFEWAEGELKELLQGCFLGPMPVWRRSLHEKYGYFDEEMRSAGDYEFWLRLAAAGERFFHVRSTRGVYLSRPDSLEHREPIRSTWETSRARGRYRSAVNGSK
jgi:hypothetical protein